MKEKYVLAFDHGTSGMKSAIVDSMGQVMDFEFKDTPLYFSPNGGAEQDPQDWWESLLQTAKILLQRKSIPRDIRQVKNPIHANARGAAFIALAGLGELTFEDVANRVQYDATFTPNPDNIEIYDELYNAFIKIYTANKKIYQKLNCP